MNCPGHTTIKDVIEFADGKLNFAKHIIHPNTKFNVYDHIDITLPVIFDGKEDFISFP